MHFGSYIICESYDQTDGQPDQPDLIRVPEFVGLGTLKIIVIMRSFFNNKSKLYSCCIGLSVNKEN